MSRRPVAPPCTDQFQLPVESFLSTPQGPHDLYVAQKKLEKCESVGRSARKLFYKAGEALAAANMRAAELETEKKRLRSQLETLGPKRPRKRVQIDPNQRFADIETIMVAVRASSLLEAQNNNEAAEKAAAKIAVETAAQTLQSM